MGIRTGKIGPPLGIPRTVGAHATVHAFNHRQKAINSFAEAMRHMNDLGMAKQATNEQQGTFKKMVTRFWTSHIAQLRKEHGAEDVDTVVKILKEKLGEPD